MEAMNEIVQELQELNSPLAGFPRTTPFAPPAEGFARYAEWLAEGTFAATGDAEIAPAYSKTMPFEVPAAYFASLPELMLEKAHSSSFRHQAQPFALPEQYFEQFAGSILEKAKAAAEPAALPIADQQQKTRSIPFFPRRVINWAAAAVVLLALGLGSYRFFLPAPSPSVEQKLSQIPESAISDYVKSNLDDFDGEMIENAAATVVAAKTTNLSGLDNKDIVQYLDENGWN